MGRRAPRRPASFDACAVFSLRLRLLSCVLASHHRWTRLDLRERRAEARGAGSRCASAFPIRIFGRFVSPRTFAVTAPSPARAGSTVPADEQDSRHESRLRLVGRSTRALALADAVLPAALMIAWSWLLREDRGELTAQGRRMIRGHAGTWSKSSIHSDIGTYSEAPRRPLVRRRPPRPWTQPCPRRRARRFLPPRDHVASARAGTAVAPTAPSAAPPVAWGPVGRRFGTTPSRRGSLGGTWILGADSVALVRRDDDAVVRQAKRWRRPARRPAPRVLGASASSWADQRRQRRPRPPPAPLRLHRRRLRPQARRAHRSRAARRPSSLDARMGLSASASNVIGVGARQRRRRVAWQRPRARASLHLLAHELTHARRRPRSRRRAPTPVVVSWSPSSARASARSSRHPRPERGSHRLGFP